MTLVTIYQANNPDTLPVMITEPKLVLESELPDRLSGINSRLDTLESNTDGITYDDTLKHTSIDGTSFQTTLGRISSAESKITTLQVNMLAISYNPMTFMTTIAGDITISNNGKLNGNKIGAPETFRYDAVTPFIPVCDTAGVTELGRYIDFHAADTSHDFYTRLMCIGQNILEIAGISSMRLSRIDVTIGMSLRPGTTLMRFMKTDNTTNLLTLDATTNEATFLGNIVAPNITSLESKTQAITYDVELNKTIIANTTETGSLKVTYATDTYTLSVGDSSVFTGSVTFQSTINGYNIENELSKLQYLSTMDDVTEVNGTFRSSNLVGITYDADLNTTFFSGNLSSPNISSMSNNLAGMIYNPDDGTGSPLTEFTHSISIDGNITADNIGTMTTNMTGITYDSEEPVTRINQTLIVNGNITADNITTLESNTQNILRIPGTDEDPISYTEIDGVSFQTTLGRISNVEGTLTKVSYAPFGEVTTISGNLSVVKLNDNNIGSPDVYRYDNVTPFLPVVGSDGIMEAGARIDFHRATTEEDYTVGLEIKASNLLAVRHTNTAYAGDLEVGTTYFRNTSGTCRLTTNQHSNMMWYNNDGTNIWIMDATSAGERWSTTRDNALAAFTRTTGMTYTAEPAVTAFSNNITAPNLTGLSYNNNFLLQATDYTAATVISNHLQVNLTGVTYKHLMGMRAYKGDLTTGQEMMIQVGKSHAAGISFVYKHNDTQANCEYRIDHPGRVAYRCYYGSTSKTEHEIRGNLTVFGTITDNASKTITHYTQYEGDLQPGFFVESTGQVFHNEEPSYENCMVIVRQATTFSNNIIGVCTEIINEEITDEYGNVNQPAGKFCRIATHGDCLIKCISDTYHLGDIIIPSASGGYGKKGSSMEIIDCMTHMVPRLKITSLETDEIDPECVVGFISI